MVGVCLGGTRMYSDAQRGTTIVATDLSKCSFYLRDRKNRLGWRFLGVDQSEAWVDNPKDRLVCAIILGKDDHADRFQHHAEIKPNATKVYVVHVNLDSFFVGNIVTSGDLPDAG
jgi:hypothetical protein